MVKIRLRRVGKKGQPSYRVVVTDSRSPRDGRFIESIGSYDPGPDPSLIEIDGARALEWMQKGAQPSEAVSRPPLMGSPSEAPTALMSGVAERTGRG